MTADEPDRPPFVHPHTEWVECYHCGQTIHDMSRVDGIDVSPPDRYYPDMKPVCAHHDLGGDDE